MMLIPTIPPLTEITRSATADKQMLETSGWTSNPIVFEPSIPQFAGHLPTTNSVFGNKLAFSEDMLYILNKNSISYNVVSHFKSAMLVKSTVDKHPCPLNSASAFEGSMSTTFKFSYSGVSSRGSPNDWSFKGI